eukprot:gene21383-biopygen14687
MSGVGAPATRPRTVARGGRGVGGTARGCRRGTATPKKEAPPPGGDEKRLLYVWGWGPSYTAPTCSAGA